MAVTVLTNSATTIREDDIPAHIDDTRLYWIFRDGRHIKRTWNEMTATERKAIQQAERREAYVAAFDIYPY